MTRIALVCDYSLEYLGGAQSAFLDEARILREHGHEVTIVAPRVTRGRTVAAAGSSPVPEGIDSILVPARWTMPVVDLPLVRNSSAVRRRLGEAFAARSIEVVHLHSEFGLTAASSQVAVECGIPLVQTVHTFFWQAGLGPTASRLASAAARLFARLVRGFPASRRRLADSAVDSALRGITLSTAERVQTVISPSAHQAARLREAGLRHVMVIENATPDGGAAGHALTAIEPPLRVAWIGRLTPEKRILEFVDAVTGAQEVLGPGALHAEVIGDGPQREAVEAAVSAAGGAAGIELLGRVPRERVRERMRAAHLVALTSFGFDNQPVTVVEALNEARAVLYVDPNLQEGLAVGGVLTESEGVDGIRDALVMLARDLDLVVARSAEAQRAASQFSPQRHVALLEQAYDDARRLVSGASPS
ncbi:glycosyltransferase family 4 protein [Microbacterium sp. CJ88]|uniref:glycosyltransferase family 4 protein n=1 Tax=Microbacterium sp. CJ88 TaxID=3445672 RepID=UPI003F65F252